MDSHVSGKLGVNMGMMSPWLGTRETRTVSPGKRKQERQRPVL